jgi:hypothetical protein
LVRRETGGLQGFKETLLRWTGLGMSERRENRSL